MTSARHREEQIEPIFETLHRICEDGEDIKVFNRADIFPSRASFCVDPGERFGITKCPLSHERCSKFMSRKKKNNKNNKNRHSIRPRPSSDEAEKPAAKRAPKLRPTDWLTIGLLHPFTAIFSFGATRYFTIGNTSLIFVVAAFVSCLAVAWPYHRDHLVVAPKSLKLNVGAAMATLCMIEGLIIQQLWTPMLWPLAVVGVSMVGSVLFPFVVFNSVFKHFREKSAA